MHILFSKYVRRLAIVMIIGSLIAYSFPGTRQIASAFGLSNLQVSNKNEFFIGPGVQHSNYSMTGKTNIQAVNTLEVDPSNKYIQLQVASPSKVLALETVRNLAKQLDRENHRVIAAFNGDFFKMTAPYAGQPIGLQIENGEIISTGVNTKSVLSIGKDGSATILDQVKMTSKVEITGVKGSRTITGINRGRNKETQPNSTFLFNSRFHSSTKTSGDEIEFLLNPSQAAFTTTTNGPITATVEDILYDVNSPIPNGKWVLAATGTHADWLFDHLEIGSELKFQINYNNELDQANYAISGGDIIVKNGAPTAFATNDKSGRHPRTMFSTKGGKLYITTFDGRQQGYSNGISLAEGAHYLAEQGMEATINMDGGGSTTYAIRLPGEQSLSILNRPSDGYERRVANTLMVVSTAPVSALSKLTSDIGDSIKVLAKTKVPITLKGQDKFYNGVPVNTSNLKWSADSSVGKVSSKGVFTAGSKKGKGKITVTSGKVKKDIQVEVVSSLSSLTISPENAIIVPGSKQTFTVKGFDSKGNEIMLTPNLLKWETTGKIGEVDSKGTLTSVNKIRTGKIIVSYGKTKAEVTVNVGKSPKVIETFSNIKDLNVSSARAVSVKNARVKNPKPVKVGKYAMSLSYDFRGTTGTSAAYMNFNDQNGKIGRPIEGRPLKLETWVYGDAKNHWLRGTIQDGNGKIITVDFTEPGKLNWKGWKKVSATIPANTPTPIKLRQIYLVETNDKNKNKGTLYFDHVRSVYTELR